MGTSNGTVIGATKIRDAGPASGKFNIVLVAEGFRSAELTDFENHCESFANFLFSSPPFNEEGMSCAVNLYRLNVASDESGADDPDCDGAGAGTTADTYFDATFCGGGGIHRLLTVDSGLVLSTVAAHVPQYHGIVVIVNSTLHGGSGGSVATTSLAGNWRSTALHELGHSPFGLADEYDYWAGCGTDTDRDNYLGGEPAEPNVTINPDRNTIKWSSLVNAISMPTLENPDCSNCNSEPDPEAAGTIGAYEGARYFHCGIYRPSHRCLMRSLGQDFCAVCQQEIIDTLMPFAEAGSLGLNTPTVMFNDIPVGTTTARAASFAVVSCLDKTFEIISGPSNPLFQPALGTVTSSLASEGKVRTAYIWLYFTGQAPGSSANGTMRVRCHQTGEEWDISLVASSIERPTAAVQLVLDRSGSMLSATSEGRTKEQVLRDSAQVLVDALYEDNGIGINGFDEVASSIMNVQVAGPHLFGAGRVTARNAINNFTANPAGMTSIGNGMEMGRNHLTSAGSSYAAKAMIILTDGMENRAKFISEVADTLGTQQVFAIGMGTGSQIDTNTLTQLTGAQGGFLLMTGALGADDTFLLAKFYLEVLAGVNNNDIVLDPEGILMPGESVRIPFDVTETDIEITGVLLSTLPPALRFYVETPEGELIEPSHTHVDPTVHYGTSLHSSLYRLSLPNLTFGERRQEGVWHGVVKFDEKYTEYLSENVTHVPNYGPGRGVKYSLNIHAYSNLKLTGSASQNSYEPGAQITVTGRLTEYGMPMQQNAQVRAEITRPDGSTVLLNLGRIEAGQYQGQMIATQAGVYRFRLRASGYTRRERPFTRERLFTAGIWQGGDKPGTGRPGPGCDCEPAFDLCRLLECLVRSGAIDHTFRKRMKEWGIDVDVALKCLAEPCRSSGDDDLRKLISAAGGLESYLLRAIRNPVSGQ